MKINPTSIPDVLVIEPDVYGDHRGFFMETWRKEWFQGVPGKVEFVQDNQSKSIKGTLRGLHYQIKQPQGKYVRVLQGEIYDVVVDLREQSPSFGKWLGITLSSENKIGLWVPPGFAHGFYVTSETAEITYKCTDYYAADFERSLLWNDPEIGIDWPIHEGGVILSEKDENAAPLSSNKTYFRA
jgi:dTDP-4-dehydrorhamnose 3,5-epimerase